MIKTIDNDVAFEEMLPQMTDSDMIEFSKEIPPRFFYWCYDMEHCAKEESTKRILHSRGVSLYHRDEM